MTLLVIYAIVIFVAFSAVAGAAMKDTRLARVAAHERTAWPGRPK